jgi:hypothetical protein
MDIKAARRVMFSSYIYLPVVLLALLFDKIPTTTKGELGSFLSFIEAILI